MKSQQLVELVLVKRRLQFQEKLLALHIDIMKTIDSVHHAALWDILWIPGILIKITNMMISL